MLQTCIAMRQNENWEENLQPGAIYDKKKVKKTLQFP